MIPYDTLFHDPPAPVALVTLRNAASGQQMPDVPMLMDTGSDVSLVPAECAAKLSLELKPELEYDVIGYDGTRRHLDSVHVIMLLNKKEFKGRFLVRDNPVGVIGRNILNQLFVTLDGKANLWNVEFR